MGTAILGTLGRSTAEPKGKIGEGELMRPVPGLLAPALAVHEAS